MKKLILTITFIFLSALSASAQCSDVDDCNKKLSDAAQMVEKLLSIQERDEKAIADRTAEVEKLKIVIRELEAQKATPCTIAQEKVKQDLTYWLNQYQVLNSKSAVGSSEKEVRKTLKFVRKNGQAAIRAQCGISHRSIWNRVWDAAQVAVPVATILLTR